MGRHLSPLWHAYPLLRVAGVGGAVPVGDNVVEVGGSAHVRVPRVRYLYRGRSARAYSWSRFWRISVEVDKDLYAIVLYASGPLAVRGCLGEFPESLS